MKYLHMTKSDGNYSVENDNHIWELPLRLHHRKIGLHSFYMDLKDDINTEKVLIVQCNLIERSMDNQHAILASIPFNKDNYSMTSSVIGKSFK